MVCFDGWSLYVTRSEACQVCTHPCKNIQVQEKKLCLWRAQRGKVCTLLGSKLTVQFFFSRQQSTRSTHGFENRPEPSVWSLSSLCVCVWLDFLNEKRERGHGDAVATFLCWVWFFSLWVLRFLPQSREGLLGEFRFSGNCILLVGLHAYLSNLCHP